MLPWVSMIMPVPEASPVVVPNLPLLLWTTEVIRTTEGDTVLYMPFIVACDGCATNSADEAPEVDAAPVPVLCALDEGVPPAASITAPAPAPPRSIPSISIPASRAATIPDGRLPRLSLPLLPA